MQTNRRFTDEMISVPSEEYSKRAKTILFATDFSATCATALNWAAALTRSLDARLLIVHVEQPGVPYGGGEIYSADVFDYHSITLLNMLEKVKPSDPTVPYCHHLLCGEPASEILRVAEEEEVNMIVMSTHGRTGISRMLVGSVAENVIRQAHCPVMVFKSPLTILRYENERSV